MGHFDLFFLWCARYGGVKDQKILAKWQSSLWVYRQPTNTRIDLICAIRLNSHSFHIGDGHQPNSRGLYIKYKDSPIKGGMTIPSIRSLDPGTYRHLFAQLRGSQKQWCSKFPLHVRDMYQDLPSPAQSTSEYHD